MEEGIEINKRNKRGRKIVSTCSPRLDLEIEK